LRLLTMVLLAAAAVAAPNVAPAASESSPADVTTAIYSLYAGPKGDYQTGNLDDKRVAAYLSKSLRAALKAMDARSKKLNEPILDFDPVTDSQDPQVEKLAIAPEGETAAVATFFSGDVKHVVRYSFVREGEAWKVDDISGGAGDEKWDLRDIIKPGKK
jgi:Protein of unknown function (DUF3828)